MDRILKNVENITTSNLPLAIGTIGEGPAYEFKGFLDAFNELPRFSDILSNPTKVPVPEEPSTLYAVSSLVASKSELTNMDKLMSFINRIPPEFQVITIKEIVKKHGNAIMKESTEVANWITTNAKELF